MQQVISRLQQDFKVTTQLRRSARLTLSVCKITSNNYERIWMKVLGNVDNGIRDR